MKNKNIDDIKALLQAWPASFADRWKRNITKDELYELLEQKLHEAQLQEMADKFFEWDVESTLNALIFLDNHKIDFIEESKTKKKKA